MRMTPPTVHLVLRDVPVPARRPTHPVRFWLWNTAGAAAMRTGTAVHHVGLRLCGVAGWLDAVADDHR